MIHRLWHGLFGYICPNCGGSGLDCIGNGWTCGCEVCHGKGRVRNNPRIDEYKHGYVVKRCRYCSKEAE